jgi:sucrose-6-phosphate hydrolase SacC (GH32 family)
LQAGADFKLHLFFDKSLLEIFADDGRLVLTRVVSSPAQALQIEVFAEGGDITIQRVESWTIRPLIL